MENNELLQKLNDTIMDFYSDKDMVFHLTDSILYSINAGGGKVRPLLFFYTVMAFGQQINESHSKVAAALELIHTSGLIHDDLPSMDNDDYRRGRYTNHKVYGEAQAILAGDALLLDPYKFLADSGLEANVIVDLVRELAYASGSYGMVAGQVLDLDGEGQDLGLDNLKKIHALKTGRMLTFPLVAGGIVTGQSQDIIEKLRLAGDSIGLAYQIRDDIKDVTVDFEQLGKTPGKDELQEKSTYVRYLGLDGAYKALSEELSAAKKLINDIAESQEFWPSGILSLIDNLDLKKEK